MRINPFFPQTLNETLKPDTVVYTMRLLTFMGDKEDPVLCDECWTTKEGRREHFWFSAPWMKDEKKQLIKSTLGEYLKQHQSHVAAMNPFYSLGRVKFLAKWDELCYRQGVRA